MLGRGIVMGALGAFVVLASLTGCSAAVSAPNWAAGGESVGAQALQHQSEPSTGACWNLTYADVVTEPAYPQGSEVDCSAAHQSYTFAMVSITANGDDSSTGAPDALDQAVNGCATQFASMFPAESANLQNRVLFESFLSTTASSTTHQPWARCDIEELAVGSNFFNPTLANLPDFSTLSADLTAHPADYALCANTPGSNGSTGPDISDATTVGDCPTAQWRLESATDTFPDPIGTAYPGYTGLYPFMHAHCGALYDTATVRGWDLYPSESQWDSGDRTFSCWVGKR